MRTRSILLEAKTVVANAKAAGLISEPTLPAALFPKKRNLELVPKIIKAVATAHGLTVEEITGRRKPIRISEPRQIAVYLIYTLCDLSQQETASFFNQHHTGVNHSLNKVKNLSDVDPAFAAGIKQWLTFDFTNFDKQ